MKVPSKKVELSSTFSPSEIMKILKKNVQKKRSVNDFASSTPVYKYFEGEFSWGKFKIKRAVKHGNAFIPEIIGELKKSDSGTKILLEFKMNKLTFALFIIWFAISLFYFLLILFTNDINSLPLVDLLLSVGFIGFGFIIICIIYPIELKKDLIQLKKISNIV
ncbi:hypothetical protein [Hanstruepera ponticola]|uniref:hypothetical protein n=1 Tax=Hanstruepera ponticola TaxID=2042995 RepID=UPI00177E40C5|nr:hypothetical protein [Hanstruepera ponticola]